MIWKVHVLKTILKQNNILYKYLSFSWLMNSLGKRKRLCRYEVKYPRALDIKSKSGDENIFSEASVSAAFYGQEYFSCICSKTTSPTLRRLILAMFKRFPNNIRCFRWPEFTSLLTFPSLMLNLSAK